MISPLGDTPGVHKGSLVYTYIFDSIRAEKKADETKCLIKLRRKNEIDLKRERLEKQSRNEMT